LLKRRSPKGYRGFESLPHRFFGVPRPKLSNFSRTEPRSFREEA